MPARSAGGVCEFQAEARVPGLECGLELVLRQDRQVVEQPDAGP